MVFPRGPIRRPAVSASRAPVFGVGRRLYVACAGDGSRHVILTDDANKEARESLGDGAEVTVVAWRPGWAGGARYCVRATASGLEGWLPVGNLRGTTTAAWSAPAALTPREDEGRRFGRRS